MKGLKEKNSHSGHINVCDDYRYILDRNDIDSVVIATPDHWHTRICIEAMRAGKDVYCEKPLSLTVREGQQIEAAVKETGRVFQVGTQQRSDFGQLFLKAIALVRAGGVGQVRKVTCAIGGTPDCPVLEKGPAPAELNFNEWLGQAPNTDYLVGDIIHPEGWGAGFPLGRTHRYFRWFYEYSGGKLTDWGAHHLDIALWAMDKLDGNMGRITIDPVMVEHPVPFKDGMPTEHDRFNTATRFNVKVTFDDGIELFIRHSAEDDLGFDNGIMFEGSKGRFLVNRGKIVGKPVENLEKNPLPSDAIARIHGGTIVKNKGGDPIGHMLNFFDCMKSRAKPVASADVHNRMLAVCHGANTAMRLDRKLTYDTSAEQFVGDKQANGFLAREQRKGYEIV